VVSLHGSEQFYQYLVNENSSNILNVPKKLYARLATDDFGSSPIERILNINGIMLLSKK